MRAIPQACIDIIKKEERLVLFAYDDKHYPPTPCQPGDKIDGTLTIGYGHTGPDVFPGMTITESIADELLDDDLAVAAGRVVRMIGADVVAALTANQWAAIVDFTFCLGTGRKDKPEWTIWKRLRAKDFDRVPVEMNRFVNWGDPPQKSEGLVRRRNAETELWAKGEPGTLKEIATPAASTTRAEPTPPTPVQPGRSKALITGSVAGAASAIPIIDKTIESIQKYAAHAHFAEIMLAVLGTAGCILAAVSIFYTWRTARNARN